jgi:hypothetical protein
MKTKLVITMIAAAFFTALALSCANQAPPGGGPADTEPPQIFTASPRNGQLNAGRAATVDIRFSEWIDKAGAAGAVSVFPAPPRGFDVKASKNRLTVTPREPLKENTTYHVVIGTSLRDLRNNALKSPINIVFSTGAELDSGEVDGSVTSLDKLPGALKAGLYMEDGDWTDARYFAAPDYAAQCDSAGTFKFSNVREGRYRLIAFDDQYRAGRLRMRDTCFAALEKTIAVTKTRQTVRLYPAESDTSKSSMLVDTSISNASKSGVLVDTSTISASELDALADTSIINVSKLDVLMPDTSEMVVSIIDTSKADVTSKTDVSTIDTLNSDTSKTAADKRRLDNICYRLQGGASCLEPDGRRKWVYRSQNKKDVFTVKDSAGTFSFDSIPASIGTLLWFIDDNGDNMITLGRLAPWRPPERFFVVQGAINARARWEIVDLQVEACE